MDRKTEQNIIRSPRFEARASEAAQAQEANKSQRGFVVRMGETGNISNIASRSAARQEETYYYDPKFGGPSGSKRFPGYGSR